MPRPNRRGALLGVLLFASAAFLLYSLQSARPRLTAADDAPARPEEGGEAQQPTEPLRPAAPADVEFARYEELASRNVFSLRRSPPPPPKKAATDLPPLPHDPPKEPTTEPKRSGFAGWTYTGYMTIDGEKRAILENDSSDSWEDVVVGDSFLGATVTEVTGEAIRFKSGSSVTTLTPTDTFPITPLEAMAGKRQPEPRRR
jgi:hypothetical protein